MGTHLVAATAASITLLSLTPFAAATPEADVSRAPAGESVPAPTVERPGLIPGVSSISTIPSIPSISTIPSISPIPSISTIPAVGPVDAATGGAPTGRAPTAAQTEIVEWAVDRFELAGLSLPSIDVSFSTDEADCNDEQGVYRRRGQAHFVTVCAPANDGAAVELRRRRTILHEFAHAWDHAHLSDDERRALLFVLGAGDWYEGDEWGERGVERLAETLVFGLLDQTRRPLLIEVDCDEAYRNFRAITGVPPLGSVRSTCVA